MRNHIDISLARFLMIFSLLLLGILEYLWLRNEYNNAYRDMEDKLSHVMFSSMRDVEDSLIFSKLTALPVPSDADCKHPVNFEIVVNTKDSVHTIDDQKTARSFEKDHLKFRPRNPVRGFLLKELTSDSSVFDTPVINISTMVMRHIRLADSTGEYAGYKLISWEGNDTVIREVMSRPQFDVFADKKIALINPQYKADLFHDLLPHFSFALFLWVMVGAAFYYIWKNLRQQIQLNALRDEFVSNITHELKTPITTVGVALESLTMASDLQNAHSRKYLDICQSELKRLSMLVERILHNRALQVHYEKMDVRQVLDEVMDHMKVQFDNKQADVDIRLDGEGFAINGDKAHIGGVLYNLFDNALKYSKGKPVIRVHLARHNGSIQLDIADNGIGIAQDYHDKIFEKLYRVPQQNRHDVKGHGLGLSYVADVIKQHHGTIQLTSEPGKGSTFTMTLPAWVASVPFSNQSESTRNDVTPTSFSNLN